ncbi:MAG: hypothetical protein ACYTHK_12660 [Planctomycetota bacterium]
MSGRTTLVILLAGGIGLAAWYLGLFDPPTAHIAALIPDDTRFAVVTSSLNDLREAYEGKYAPRDADPAKSRFGQPVNVPELDGIDYDRPAGYFSKDGKLVYLVPVVDQGAFEDAHSEARDNIRAQAPVRVAKHYLSVADSDAVATAGPDSPWILEASAHPLALVGRPVDGPVLRGMLVSFFGPDPLPRVRNSLPIATLCARLAPWIADPMAAEIEQMRLALPEQKKGRQVRLDLLVQPSSSSRLARAADFAPTAKVSKLLGYMPAGGQIQTTAGVSVVLDAGTWKEYGSPFDVGPAAGAVGLVTLRFRAGKYALVFALAPTDAQRVADIEIAPPEAEEREVDGAKLRIWKLKDVPSWMEKFLVSDAAKAPAPYVCTARTNEAWFCAIGAHAEEVMRAVVQAATGRTQKSLRHLVGDENRKVAPTRAHGRFFDSGRIAIGFMEAQAQRALQFPLPYVPMASIGQPEAVTFTLALENGRLRGDLRCFVADAE